MQLGVASTGPVSNSMCWVYQTADYSNTAAADLTFNTNPYGSTWWVAGSPTLITVPFAGLYTIRSDFATQFSAAALGINLLINGTARYPLSAEAGSVSSRSVEISVWALAANDVLKFNAKPTGAGTYTVYGYNNVSSNVTYFTNSCDPAGATIYPQGSFSVFVEYIGGGF